MVEFIESLTWVEESILKHLKKSIHVQPHGRRVHRCKHRGKIACVLPLEEDGVPVECFLEIIPLKKADAETIYSILIECLKRKNLQVGRIVGLGFDGAATFSG